MWLFVYPALGLLPERKQAILCLCGVKLSMLFFFPIGEVFEGLGVRDD